MVDPGRAHLFQTVYVRGPMALQALRNTDRTAANGFRSEPQRAGPCAPGHARDDLSQDPGLGEPERGGQP